MSIFEFPNQADIRRICDTTSFDQLNKQIFSLLNGSVSQSGFSLSGFKKVIDAKEFLWQLHYRLMDVAKSYALLSYFLEKGIPDEEWYISPGKSGASVEYFPNFEPLHFEIKDWFDYYSDIFYYKYFSALDMVGHFLNVRHKLRIEQQQVSFHRAVDKLCDRDNCLHRALNTIRNSDTFCEANRLRNDFTHNCSPSSTGISVTLTEKGGGIGIRDYTPSAAIIGNVREAIGLLEKIITLVIA